MAVARGKPKFARLFQISERIIRVMGLKAASELKQTVLYLGPERFSSIFFVLFLLSLLQVCKSCYVYKVCFTFFFTFFVIFWLYLFLCLSSTLILFSVLAQLIYHKCMCCSAGNVFSGPCEMQSSKVIVEHVTVRIAGLPC